MYEVRNPNIYGRDQKGLWSGLRQDRYILIAENLPTLEAAKAARVVSGDLVYHSVSGRSVLWSNLYRPDDGRIVTDPSWLWEWELKDLGCYAQRAIAWQKVQ